MNVFITRPVLGLAVAAILAACGANTASDQPARTAGLVQSATGTAQPVVTVATATMPAPDCAAQGCSGLRIVDANAEAYRYEAMRHARTE